MNLFVDSLANYIIEEWDRVLGQPGDQKEARFIVQSLDSKSTLELFSILDKHRLESLRNKNITCYFRAATNLYEEWCNNDGGASNLHQQMDDCGAIDDASGEMVWIDEDDKLTWYRNRTAAQEKADALIVVLVGASHATDQGGLNDFHRVDEKRIWAKMENSFFPWLKKLVELLSLEGTADSELESFDTVLQMLYKLRPITLNKLAKFIDKDIANKQKYYDFSELRDAFFEQLPYWQIPMVLNDDNAGTLSGKKGAAIIKRAESFISYQDYKTPKGRKRDYDKIELEVNKNEFEMPKSLNNEVLFSSKDEYLSVIQDFINNASLDAKNTLLKTDFLPLYKILGKKSESTLSSKDRIIPLDGMSFEIFMKALFNSIGQYAKEVGHDKIPTSLAGIHIELTRFEHDLSDDKDNGIGTETLAKNLIKGCLGGIEEVFDSLDCNLPIDSEEKAKPIASWSNALPITIDLGIDQDISIGTSRARPNIKFKISITDNDLKIHLYNYKWNFGPTHPERVRYECVKEVCRTLNGLPQHFNVLPAFKIPSSFMAAVYFAADEDEANRLISQAISDLEIIDLLKDIDKEVIDPDLWNECSNLTSSYFDWLTKFINHGYFKASRDHSHKLVDNYIKLAESALNTDIIGSETILKRLYKAFFIIDENTELNAPYLPGAIAWGLSPSVLELTEANTRFFAEGIAEVIGDLCLHGTSVFSSTFEKLIDLGQIHRPIVGLMIDNQLLSAEIKSFGLIHYFGPEPDTSNSLAVQTLLREDDSGEDDNIRDFIKPCEERDLVLSVLKDYRRLYPFSQDGIRIIAINVMELHTILSGVDLFLDTLDETPGEWPPYKCSIMVYSSSSSPMAMENRLTLWRKDVLERRREKGRQLILSVSHRHAPEEKIVDLLNKEENIYDVAFLFHFLKAGLTGHADRAKAFEYDLEGFAGLQFPITEYPRPTKQTDLYRRQVLLSNRRLRIQSRHADMSARFRNNTNSELDHLIYGQVNYEPWQDKVKALHDNAQWVVCIDPYVDKKLLCQNGSNTVDSRKIVGFMSGLGSYGELNLSISTELDTIKQLNDKVSSKLNYLLPYAQIESPELMASRVVEEAEDVIGLSSLRAVVGDGEQIREVLGLAAIKKILCEPKGVISQLIPLDSQQHWFAGKKSNGMRPDLIQLTLEVRDGGRPPLISAVVIECKFAQNNPAHLAKANEQVQEGIQHLSLLFAPKNHNLIRTNFDRRYWWGQLHRALTSRSIVNISDNDWRTLDYSLERITNGDFDIEWKGCIFTFWTNEALPKLKISNIPFPNEIVQPSFKIEEEFFIQHIELGYEGVCNIFEGNHPYEVTLAQPSISITPSKRAEERKTKPSADSNRDNEKQINQKSFNDVDEMGKDPNSQQPDTGPHKNIENTEIIKNEEIPPLEREEEQQESPNQEISHEETIADILVETEEINVVSPPTTEIPERILIGTRTNNDPVYWHFGHPKLSNRHMLIFGTSGSGKTYGIQCLLAEMSCNKLHSLIVDYTDGFLSNQVEDKFKIIAKPKNHFVMTEKLPLNPFRRQKIIIDESIPAIEESPYQVATRVESIFSSIFELGDQQRAALVRVIRAGLEISSNYSLSDVPDDLRQEGRVGETLANKLEPLIHAEPFRTADESAWEEMLQTKDHSVHIMQLKGLARQIQKMVTEFVLWDLWDFAQSTGSKNRPIPIVLDEIQNLDHSSDSPIDKMLREGRKFGLSLILATQTTSQFN